MYAIEIDKEVVELAKPYYEKIIIGYVEDETTLDTLVYLLGITLITYKCFRTP
ncbi:MAG: hypothetical protein ABDH23_04965 [Endomicrobiia bacterium]